MESKKEVCNGKNGHIIGIAIRYDETISPCPCCKAECGADEVSFYIGECSRVMRITESISGESMYDYDTENPIGPSGLEWREVRELFQCETCCLKRGKRVCNKCINTRCTYHL